MVRSDAGPCISGPATVGLAGDGDLGQSSQQPVSQETQALRSETLMSPDNSGEWRADDSVTLCVAVANPNRDIHEMGWVGSPLAWAGQGCRAPDIPREWLMMLHGQHSHWPKTPSTELSVYTEPGHQRERETAVPHRRILHLPHSKSDQAQAGQEYA